MTLHLDIEGKSYEGTGKVLAPLKLDIAKGQFVCVLGPSGCGKTTLLNIIAELIQPDHTQMYHHTPATSLSYVFQEPRLMPWLTVLDNVLLVKEHKNEKWQKRAHELLVQVGLADKIHAYPHHLSGGQKRRASLARAFFNDPTLLLMDEPFASLDAPSAQNLRELTLALWQKNNTTILFVTHDLEEALFLGERILLLGKNPTSVLYDGTANNKKLIKEKYDQFYRQK